MQNKYILEEVFSFEHLMLAAKLCLTGDVTWKKTVRAYQDNLIARIADLHERLINEKYLPDNTRDFDKPERGKIRHINALHIEDRIVQRCFCEFCLCPLLQPRLMFDSGATIPGKGTLFVHQRLLKHLHDYSNNYETDDGYAVVMDFHSYFELIDLEILFKKIHKVLHDSRLFKLYQVMAKKSTDRGGLGLGSQISQISALYYMADLDNYVKRQLRCKYYVRCADDAVIILPTRSEAQDVLAKIIEFAKKDKFIFNEKKTGVFKISNGIPFIHRRFYIKNGNSFSIPIQKTAKECIRRIKEICYKIETKNVDPFLLYQSFQSWESHLKYDKASNIIARTKGKNVKIISTILEKYKNNLSKINEERIKTLSIFKTPKVKNIVSDWSPAKNNIFYNKNSLNNILLMRKRRKRHK